MATKAQIEFAAMAVREAVQAGAVEWEHPEAAMARAYTADLGMSWDFTTWPDALADLESAEVGERVFGVAVESGEVA